MEAATSEALNGLNRQRPALLNFYGRLSKNYPGLFTMDNHS